MPKPAPKKEEKEWSLAGPPMTKRKSRIAAKRGEKPSKEQTDDWSIPLPAETNAPAPTAKESDIWDTFFTPTNQGKKDERNVVPSEEKDMWDFFSNPTPSENVISAEVAPQQSIDPEREERIQNALQLIPDISFVSNEVLFS